MKTLLLSTAVILAFLPATDFAQITINYADMPQAGDTISRNVDTMTTLTAGPAGANKSWVMTTATVHTTDVTKMMTPSSTPYASSFSSSNIAMTNDNTNYIYFNQSNSSSIIKGLAGDLLMTGSMIVAPFNPDMLLHNFPRTYGSNFSDTYTMDITVSGSTANQPVDQVRFKRMATGYDTTDGWGTISTPVGKYQVLRVKRVDFPIDSTWVKYFSFSPWSLVSTKVDTTYGYTWLSKEGKLAIAELANDSMDNPKKFTWSLIAPLSATVSSTNATCNGTCNGSATVTASGLYSPYTYAWSGGQTGATASGLCAGTHSVTVTDNLGNIASAYVSITEPTAINLSTTSANATCGANNGSATVTATGALGPYVYSWSNGQTNATASGLAAGSYTVTVTDAGGCSNTSTANVSSSGGATVSVTSANVNCSGGNDGSATATATGGVTPYTYLWTGGQTTATATGLTAGNYNVTVTGSNTCASVASVTVTEPTAITVTTSSTNASSSTAADGSASVVTSGGTTPYTFMWSNSQTTQTASGLAAGTYTVTVTDANGCTADTSVTVNFTSGISVQNSSETIIVFPNPASEKIYFSGLTDVSGVMIIDVTGRLVENVLLRKNNSFIPVANYENGIYFYRLTDSKGNFLSKGKFGIAR